MAFQYYILMTICNDAMQEQYAKLFLWQHPHPRRISPETSHLSDITTFELQCIITEHKAHTWIGQRNHAQAILPK